MTITRLITLNICVLSINLYGAGLEPAIVRIVEGNDINAGNAVHAVCFVGLTNLVAEPSWEPYVNSLPNSLIGHVNRTRYYIMEREHLTNIIKLARVDISLLNWDYKLSNANNVSPLTNKWMIKFSFYSPQERLGYLTASALLNNEGFSKIASIEQKQEWSEQNGISNALVPTAKWVSKDVLINPSYNTLHSSDFKCPKVQWDGDGEIDYPINLHSDANRGRELLAVKLSISSENLILTHIILNHYVPLEASQFQHLEISEKLNHWLTVFEYEEKNPVIKRSFYVCELLDGTIINE